MPGRGRAAMCALKLDAKYTTEKKGHRRGRRNQVGFIDQTRPRGLAEAVSCPPWKQP